MDEKQSWRTFKVGYVGIWIVNLLLVIILIFTPISLETVLWYLIVSAIVIEFLKSAMLYVKGCSTNTGLTAVISKLIGWPKDENSPQGKMASFYYLLASAIALLLAGLILKIFSIFFGILLL